MESSMFDTATETFGSALPTVLGALVVLIIGWLVAKTISKMVKKGLNKMQLDERLKSK